MFESEILRATLNESSAWKMSTRKGKKGADDLQAQYVALNSIRRSLQTVYAMLPALGNLYTLLTIQNVISRHILKLTKKLLMYIPLLENIYLRIKNKNYKNLDEDIFKFSTKYYSCPGRGSTS